VDEVEVFPYSIDTLRRLLSEKARAASEVINSKCHVGYFESYFDHLKAATIVVENEYIDRDFLEDFAAYYVRCFPDYSRKCVRLHFFRDDFSRDDLLALLAGDASPLTETSLRDSYLGHKPSLAAHVYGHTRKSMVVDIRLQGGTRQTSLA
jgi:hypothetical protein